MCDVAGRPAGNIYSRWERVEKLEKILDAEDAARAEVERARIAAAATLSTARATTAEMLRAGREDILAAAAAHHEATLAQARVDAAAYTETAHAASQAVIADAGGRADDALDAVLRSVKGQ